mmetsp:Transcript_14590/g.30165  ORF Transcript_14590/g.30165 Transcript_14590/m.30165 type:complete len:284 (-) Transcript_14590:734-1585(-)
MMDDNNLETTARSKNCCKGRDCGCKYNFIVLVYYFIISNYAGSPSLSRHKSTPILGLKFVGGNTEAHAIEILTQLESTTSIDRDLDSSKKGTIFFCKSWGIGAPRSPTSRTNLSSAFPDDSVKDSNTATASREVVTNFAFPSLSKVVRSLFLAGAYFPHKYTDVFWNIMQGFRASLDREAASFATPYRAGLLIDIVPIFVGSVRMYVIGIAIFWSLSHRSSHARGTSGMPNRAHCIAFNVRRLASSLSFDTVGKMQTVRFSSTVSYILTFLTFKNLVLQSFET